jgi:peptidoglycan hydrolase-like protein with peptidoglycan-binding domain
VTLPASWTALPRERRARRLVAVAGLGVALAALFAVVLPTFRGSHHAAASTVPTGLARVVRTDVIERQQVAGTLGFRGSYTIAAGSGGVVTYMPPNGTIVRRGQTLYALNRHPVTLLYGSRPAYRDFTLGMSGGADVALLQANLRALGFTAGGALTVSGRFDVATLAAVEAWQRSRGLPATGDLAVGDVVFLPGAARVGQASAGSGAVITAGAPVMTATAAQPAVLVPLDPGTVAQIKVGDHVLVTMPDNSIVRGHVSSISRVATTPAGADQNGQNGGQATPTIPVTVALDRAATGALDEAPVQVAITAQEDRNVLAVPINALLAQPGGGYAVELRSGRTSRFVRVTTGLFDDVAGRVEVSGRGLAAGERVEVPR